MKRYFFIAIIELSIILFLGNVYANVADTNLVIGNFRISKVIDADTFRFENLDNSTRLLGIDTEETFKTADAGQMITAISQDWNAYYIAEKGDSKMPVKSNSPFGYEAWKWAEEFFKDAENVRLEKEDDDRAVDIFGRYLVYLFVTKDGKEINYNVECVRLGYSPYFNKYGNSKRFHNEFTEAQNYAQQNRLGVWDPEKKHYPDYDERIQWWNKRAAQLENYETKYSGNENYFNLSADKDFKRLNDCIGKEVIVFGSIGDILKKKFPYLIRIPHNKNENFDIVVREENLNLLDELDIETKKDYYIYLKGKLETFNGGLQIELTDAGQLWIE